MISIDNVIKFCKEDPSLIENYEKAVNDKSQTYDIHHRLELDENKTRAQLKAEGRYYNRPAAELIFLTHSEHIRIHKTGKQQSEETIRKRSEALKGKNKGKHQSEETRKKISEFNKKYYKENSGIRNGKNNPMYGRKASFETRKKQSESHKGRIQSKETRNKISAALMGKNKGKNPEKSMSTEAIVLHRERLSEAASGRCWMTNGIDKVWPKKEESYKYLELGYQYGKKLKNI